MVPFALAGTAVWAAVGVVASFAGAPADWLRICLAGVLLGLGLSAAMLVRDRRHRLRRTSPAPGQPLTSSTSESS